MTNAVANFEPFIIYRCIVGSRAYGLATDDSDHDRRGFYLPPAELHWSLDGVPEQIERPETEECYWEFEKYLRLALQGNPNIIECLYTPLVEHAAPLAQEVRAARRAFLSRRSIGAFRGYAEDQFRRLANRLARTGEVKWKHAMHLLRLLLSGIHLARTGDLCIDVGPHRGRLLEIRDGGRPWGEVEEWRLALEREFDEAFAASPLPETPDRAVAERLLLKARRMAAGCSVGSAHQASAAAQRTGGGLSPPYVAVAPAQPPALTSGEQSQTALAGIDPAAAGVLRGIVAPIAGSLLFATISGAHLYGFPSPDSDYDLRGVHVLGLREVVGLDVEDETRERSWVVDGIELDLVTHDVRKFVLLMLKRNGYVLEQLLSPLVVHTTPEHAELRELARGCITRNHAHHYLGFARTQWSLFEKDRRVKPLLYTFRVLLTGIHLMRTGEVEANLVRLNGEFRLAYLDELIARKTQGSEDEELDAPAIDFHRGEVERLTRELEAARGVSRLPEAPGARRELDEFVAGIRLRGVNRDSGQG